MVTERTALAAMASGANPSEIPLKPLETEQAIAILLHNLATSDDWIVTNLTLESLATFVRSGAFR